MAEVVVLVAVLLAVGTAAIFYRRERTRRRVMREGAAIIDRGLAQLDSPKHVIPPPPDRTRKHLGMYQGGMGALTATPMVAWARDHHVPAILAVAGVGVALAFIPSFEPREGEPAPPPLAEAPPATTYTPGPPPHEPSVQPSPEPSPEETSPDAGGTEQGPETTDPTDSTAGTVNVDPAPAGTPQQRGGGRPPPDAGGAGEGDSPPPDEPPGDDPPKGEPEPRDPEPSCSIIHVDLQPTAELCILPE